MTWPNSPWVLILLEVNRTFCNISSLHGETAHDPKSSVSLFDGRSYTDKELSSEPFSFSPSNHANPQPPRSPQIGSNWPVQNMPVQRLEAMAIHGLCFVVLLLCWKPLLQGWGPWPQLLGWRPRLSGWRPLEATAKLGWMPSPFLCGVTLGLEAIAIRLEAIAIRVEAIAARLEAIMPLGWRPSPLLCGVTVGDLSWPIRPLNSMRFAQTAATTGMFTASVRVLRKLL